MSALLVLATVLGFVLAFSVIALAWLAFGMSYTLTQLLILLKDQDSARREGEAIAVAIRTRRHVQIADYLNETVKALIGLRTNPPRIEEEGAASDEDRKTLLMQPASPTTLGENAPEQPPAVTVRNVQRPALLPMAPTNPSSEAGRDSNSEPATSGGPPSRSTRVGFIMVPGQ